MYRISVGGEPPRTQWLGRICPGILKKSAHPSKKIKPSKAQFFLLVGQLSLVRGWPSRTHSSGAIFFCERDNIILEENKVHVLPFLRKGPYEIRKIHQSPPSSSSGQCSRCSSRSASLPSNQTTSPSTPLAQMMKLTQEIESHEIREKRPSAIDVHAARGL